MRILRVAQKIYPDVVGGGPYHVHALSRDQAAMGHDITVLTVKRNASSPAFEERDGYRVIRKPVHVELFGNEFSMGIARQLGDLRRYDLLHAHSHLYLSSNLAAVKRRVGSTPFAITNHGLYSQSAPRRLFNLYLRTLGRFTFNSADTVFCYTGEDRRRLRALGVHSPIQVVPNGIETSRFTPDGPISEHRPPDCFVVLFVGRLVAGKRPQDVIMAVAAVIERDPNVALLFVGDGPMRSDLARLASGCHISDRVKFLGEIDHLAMPKLYRAADVLVLPSQNEGFPRTVLEALATETPVVTSNLDQLQFIADEVGLTAEIGDVDGFASAMQQLKDDSDQRRTFGVRGREMVEKRYDWSSTVAQTTDYLCRLVENA